VLPEQFQIPSAMLPTLLLCLLFLPFLLAQDSGLIYTYVSFVITVTLDGDAPSMCTSSQRIRLRNTLRNGLRYHGNQFLQINDFSDESKLTVFDFDAAGERIDGTNLRRLTDTSGNTFTYKAVGGFICPSTFCTKVDNIESRRQLKPFLVSTQTVTMDSYMSEKLTQDVRFWIHRMNINEGEISCLGSGMDVTVDFALLDDYIN